MKDSYYAKPFTLNEVLGARQFINDQTKIHQGSISKC